MKGENPIFEILNKVPTDYHSRPVNMKGENPIFEILNKVPTDYHQFLRNNSLIFMQTN